MKSRGAFLGFRAGLGTGIRARIVLVLTIAISGCCGSFDPDTSKEDVAARAWLHMWPDSAAWQQRTGWEEVSELGISKATTLLLDKPFVPLTEQQAGELMRVSSVSQKRAGSFYLLRAVGAAGGKLPLQLFLRGNGEVWVGGEAISRCPVPMRRRPVVIWLETPPSILYVTFLVGK
jgi:hypothetical protein